jgi:hypothetical protein
MMGGASCGLICLSVYLMGVQQRLMTLGLALAGGCYLLGAALFFFPVGVGTLGWPGVFLLLAAHYAHEAYDS